MRITFLILLLANLVLVLWHTQIRMLGIDTDSFPDIPEEQRLVLISERPKPEAAPDQAEVPATESIMADLDLPDIQIIGTGTDSSDAVNDLAAEPDLEVESEVTARFCYTLGPVKDIGLAKMISDRLTDLGATTSRRSKVEQEQYGYRVYLKPYATREEAVAEARKLAENGVRDYYIITDDADKENGISLGLFRKKSGAIRRMAQIRRFDFKPYLEVRYRDTTIYWLDFEHAAEIDSRALLLELSEENPELQRLNRTCEVEEG